MSAPARAAQPSPDVTTEGCRYCWMCRQACPVGLVTSRETFTPHAWALTIESVRRGQLTWNAEAVDVLYACADCGLCRAHCATDRPLPDAIVAARTEVAAKGAAPAAVYELERQWKSASPSAAAGPAPSATALFVGDAGAHDQSRAVEAAQRLLAAAGITAAPLATGRSTGLLASSLGLAGTAASLARAVVADVSASGAREVLVLTPGDRFAFEHVYPVRLGVAWPENVRVREVVEVLDEARAAGRLTLKPATASRPYAYHDPCHSARVERDHGAPRRLLAAVLGASQAREVFWRERRAHPCGAVGGLRITTPAVAAQLSAARLADAAEAGAEWFLTEDPLCRHHLETAPARGIEVRGLFETLARHV